MEVNCSEASLISRQVLKEISDNSVVATQQKATTAVASPTTVVNKKQTTTSDLNELENQKQNRPETIDNKIIEEKLEVQQQQKQQEQQDKNLLDKVKAQEKAASQLISTSSTNILPDIVNVQPIPVSEDSCNNSISALINNLNGLNINSEDNSTLTVPIQSCDVGSSDEEIFAECQTYTEQSLSTAKDINTSVHWVAVLSNVTASNLENIDTTEQVDTHPDFLSDPESQSEDLNISNVSGSNKTATEIIQVANTSLSNKSEIEKNKKCDRIDLKSICKEVLAICSDDDDNLNDTSNVLGVNETKSTNISASEMSKPVTPVKSNISETKNEISFETIDNNKKDNADLTHEEKSVSVLPHDEKIINCAPQIDEFKYSEPENMQVMENDQNSITHKINEEHPNSPKEISSNEKSPLKENKEIILPENIDEKLSTEMDSNKESKEISNKELNNTFAAVSPNSLNNTIIEDVHDIPNNENINASFASTPEQVLNQNTIVTSSSSTKISDNDRNTSPENKSDKNCSVESMDVDMMSPVRSDSMVANCTGNNTKLNSTSKGDTFVDKFVNPMDVTFKTPFTSELPGAGKCKNVTEISDSDFSDQFANPMDITLKTSFTPELPGAGKRKNVTEISDSDLSDQFANPMDITFKTPFTPELPGAGKCKNVTEISDSDFSDQFANPMDITLKTSFTPELPGAGKRKNVTEISDSDLSDQFANPMDITFKTPFTPELPGAGKCKNVTEISDSDFSDQFANPMDITLKTSFTPELPGAGKRINVTEISDSDLSDQFANPMDITFKTPFTPELPGAGKFKNVTEISDSDFSDQFANPMDITFKTPFTPELPGAGKFKNVTEISDSDFSDQFANPMDITFKTPFTPELPGAGKRKNVTESLDSDFSGQEGLILSPSDFDYLLTKGNNTLPIDDRRSSLLHRFDPLLREPVPVKQSQINHSNNLPTAIAIASVTAAATVVPSAIPSKSLSHHQQRLGGGGRLSPSIEVSGEEELHEDNSPQESLPSKCYEKENLNLTKDEINELKQLKNLLEYKKELSALQQKQREQGKKENSLGKNISNEKMSVDMIQAGMKIENDSKPEQNISSKSEEKKEYKMDDLEKKIKNEVLKTEDIEKKLKDAEQREEALLKRITEKDKTISKMSGVIEAYEKAIAELIAEKEQIIQNFEKQMSEIKSERDLNYQHLTSLESTFSDLHVKYERSKQLTAKLKSSEEELKAEKNQNIENLRLQEQRYEKMKNHALQQLEIANNKLESLTKNHTMEVSRLKALLKKEEISRISLNEQLQQKVRENEELMKICDELINGQGASS